VPQIAPFLPQKTPYSTEDMTPILDPNVSQGDSMAKRAVFHVTQNQQTDKWQVKEEGHRSPESTHRTQAAAIDAAKRMAKAEDLGQVKIHGENGRIRTEYTYGQDPYPPKG
jgi:hypothetical protein